ncbi:molybdopterin molybdenumtransferase MoeA [Agrobacterium vitis]|uniref:molybdopterin molybdotransferase MoeA n=1 Tax=Agrobacterium vitis TaxID=373 RepID=UPI0015DA85E0|nr:gephyrin-like molybdotransferase Glp [Agrobacterium vitis]BCH62849.1 molybdopterin molybdenumtransferase MoeA [Agrobacterium vitis]
MALLPVEEAQARLLASATPVQDTEILALRQARNRILAEDMAARLTQPPFDASAMDGYALRAEDALSPGSELSVVGQSAAGHGFDGRVGAGQCVRIFTGAPVPEGADSVLIQEDTEPAEKSLRIRTTFAAVQGRHIRPRGQDFAEGTVLIPAGKALDFAKLMLAASGNHANALVYRKPLIVLLATGDELVISGTAPGPNQIIASNTFAIAALAENLGADVLDLGIVPDDHDAIVTAIRKAEAAGADVLVTTGGASVGDHDLVQAALTDAGMVLDFWKIAMRPGKPLMVGKLGSMHVLGLPGNPISSMVCSLLFLEPLIAKLGHRALPQRLRHARTATALAANDQRQDYLRAQLRVDSADGLWVTTFPKQDSSMMRIFAEAGALIVRPPHASALREGGQCMVLLLHP